MQKSSLIKFIQNEFTRTSHTNLSTRMRKEVDKEDFDNNFHEVVEWLKSIIK